MHLQLPAGGSSNCATLLHKAQMTDHIHVQHMLALRRRYGESGHLDSACIFQKHLSSWRVLQPYVTQPQPPLKLTHAVSMPRRDPKARHGLSFIGKGSIKFWT